jgi:hypothetical protein
MLEVVLTIFTGNVHTALKRQAPLRLRIQRVQTISVFKAPSQNLSLECRNHPTEHGYPFSPQQFHAIVENSIR